MDIYEANLEAYTDWLLTQEEGEKSTYAAGIATTNGCDCSSCSTECLTCAEGFSR